MTIDGVTIHKTNLHEISKYVGTVLQDQDGQFVGLSVGEDVAFYYENHNVDRLEMITGVNEAFDCVCYNF